MDIKKINHEQENIWKYIFSADDAIVEAVLVKNKSVSISCSVMCGCPAGCRMCGAGAGFIRNLTAEEIMQQVNEILKDQELESLYSFQIAFSNMGEPLLNWDAVEIAVRDLHRKYPHAYFIISTIGPSVQKIYEKLLKLSKDIPQVNLQFTLHKANDIERDWAIPNIKVLRLSQIRDIGILWNRVTLRLVQLNYAIDKDNSTSADLTMLQTLFSPTVFSFAFYSIYPKDRDKKTIVNKEQMEKIRKSFGFIYNLNFIDDLYQQESIVGAVPGQVWETQQSMQQTAEKKE